MAKIKITNMKNEIISIIINFKMLEPNQKSNLLK